MLNSEKDSPTSVYNFTLTNLIEDKQTNNLNTEVGILESPSILMPVYECN